MSVAVATKLPEQENNPHIFTVLASQVDVPAHKVIWLGILLALFQAMDGIFTTMGIERFGLAIEGNPLLRTLMAEFGHVQTLTFLKVAAILIVAVLTTIAIRLPWVRNAMGAVACLYFFTAILPWTYVLFVRPMMG